MIRLDGQVAVITGAGRGIGREYALLLAGRGAAVVVNDIGADVQGTGSDSSVARAVVDEIGASGGIAAANHSDISTPEGGEDLVAAALDHFGRVDILIHNAGSLHRAPFEEVSIDAATRVLATHLLGAFHVGQPAWRAMLRQRYGRVLLTTSVALFGAPDLTVYSAAKAGCVALARALSLEADRSGADIKVNAISPTAATRRASFSHRNDPGAASVDAAFGDRLHPRNVAAAALPLVAPSCDLNGVCVKAGGGVVASIFSGMTAGWATPDVDTDPEDVQSHLADAMSLEGFSLPKSSAEARAHTLDAVRRAAPPLS
jgi:NAD(P)-dependent dehydrogenase (short-subunit alcohol dehydrogenase family)